MNNKGQLNIASIQMVSTSSVENNLDIAEELVAKAKAAGKNTIELEQMKRNALIERIKAEAQATLMLVKLNGEFTDDQKKRIKELSDMAVKLTQDSVVARIAEEKRLSDEHKKELDKRKKDKEDAKKEEDDNRIFIPYFAWAGINRG